MSSKKENNPDFYPKGNGAYDGRGGKRLQKSANEARRPVKKRKGRRVVAALACLGILLLAGTVMFQGAACIQTLLGWKQRPGTFSSGTKVEFLHIPDLRNG